MANNINVGTAVNQKVSNIEIQKKKLFNAKVKTLSNGLNVIVIEDKEIPRISVGVLYGVGSCDDPENLFGLSHITEHMFFHGSKKYPHLDKTIGNVGGEINACTSEDFTMYITDCPNSALPLIFDIESDRMGNFSLKNKEIFEKEQMAVFEERLMSVENQPLGVAFEYIYAALSPQHPYGKEIIGTRKNIKSYSMQVINEHYKKWYKPNNAHLIVIGDVDGQSVFNLAEQYFGQIPAGEVPKREREKNALENDISHKITYYSDKVATSKVRMLFSGLHHTNCTAKEFFALNIGLAALFDGVAFEFYRYFSDTKSLVSSMNCYYQTSLDPKPICISVDLMPGVQSKPFLKKFFERLRRAIANGLDVSEFNRAKQGYLTSATYATCDSHSKIRLVFAKLAMGWTVNQIESTLDDIDSVTIEDVNKQLRTVFEKSPIGLVIVSPKNNKKGAKFLAS
jgi:zinc protease